MQFWKFQTCPKTWKIGMHFSFNIPVTMQFQKFCRPAAKPSNFNFLTNQRAATEILTNDITWREIHFGFLTNQRTIKSLLASLN